MRVRHNDIKRHFKLKTEDLSKMLTLKKSPNTTKNHFFSGSTQNNGLQPTYLPTYLSTNLPIYLST